MDNPYSSLTAFTTLHDLPTLQLLYHLCRTLRETTRISKSPPTLHIHAYITLLNPQPPTPTHNTHNNAQILDLPRPLPTSEDSQYSYTSYSYDSTTRCSAASYSATVPEETGREDVSQPCQCHNTNRPRTESSHHTHSSDAATLMHLSHVSLPRQSLTCVRTVVTRLSITSNESATRKRVTYCSGEVLVALELLEYCRDVPP